MSKATTVTQVTIPPESTTTTVKLSTLGRDPSLVEVLIDDEETVTSMGGSVLFKTWDRIPLADFMKIAKIRQAGDTESLFPLVAPLILDEEGKAIDVNRFPLK
jgi:hypothetical protein